MTDNNNKLDTIVKKDDKSTEKSEVGGPKGLEPTRYGVPSPEWEVKGRVSDF